MAGPFGPGGVPISGFAMLQHQIKAVHESAHQEEKQRQDQGDLERRPPFNTCSPTILDRDGKKQKLSPFCPHLPFLLFIALSTLFPVAASSGLFIANALFRLHSFLFYIFLKETFEGDLDCRNVVQLEQRQRSQLTLFYI